MVLLPAFADRSLIPHTDNRAGGLMIETSLESPKGFLARGGRISATMGYYRQFGGKVNRVKGDFFATREEVGPLGIIHITLCLATTYSSKYGRRDGGWVQCGPSGASRCGTINTVDNCQQTM